MTERATPPASGTSTMWPSHAHETRPWRQTVRGGTADDRKLSEVVVSLPPLIADLPAWTNPRLGPVIEQSLAEIAALDATHGQHLDALGTLLLRTESVASSKIEHVEADIDAYARALHGVRANEAATSMAAATTALAELIDSVAGGADLTFGAIRSSHRSLMRDDPVEAAYAGRVRDVQNWIGGSDHSPRNALYVPPPPELVDRYMGDLIAFANRDDLSVFVQSAIAHAQFESIHPFTDGNGRVGRALVNTILRRRGVTTRVVIPMASALVARRDRYFDVLNAYRAGDADAIISSFADASAIAAHESRITAARIAAFPDAWRQQIGRIRSGSATARLFDRLAEFPVFSADEAEKQIGGHTASTYNAIDRFVSAGVLRPLTERKRNQVWGVADMLDELNDLSTRIAAAAI
jgi:Fic family protein